MQIFLKLSQRSFKLLSSIFFFLFIVLIGSFTLFYLLSLMNSFVLPSQLFIPSNVSFISVIIFFSSDWFFFIFPSSLLEVLLYSSILFPSSVSILITNAFNSLFGKLFVSLVVLFGVFPLLFHLKKKKKKLPCLLILFNFLCLYETWWNSYLSWPQRCALTWEHPDADRMCPVAFMGELEWAQVTFSPRVSRWWEVGLEMEGLSQNRELELPLCCDCHYPIRAELSPKVLEQKPWGHIQAGSVPSKCVFSPSNLTFTPNWSCAKASRAKVGAQCRLGYEHWDGPRMQVRALATPHPMPPPTRAALALSRCRQGCAQLCSLQGNSSFTLAGSCTSVGGAGQGLAHSGSTHGWSWETGQSPRQFQPASCPLFQEWAGMCSSQTESGFPTALL